MKVAIIVGHSEDERGAYNSDYRISEFEFNNIVANHLKLISEHDIEVVYRNKYYELPEKVNKINAKINISLHCNAFNQTATGTEVLSSGSAGSLKLASYIQSRMIELFELSDRGVKIRTEGRGAYILMQTIAPTILIEPFFIDNNFDIKKGILNIVDYAFAINEAIKEYETNL